MGSAHAHCLSRVEDMVRRRCHACGVRAGVGGACARGARAAMGWCEWIRGGVGRGCTGTYESGGAVARAAWRVPHIRLVLVCYGTAWFVCT